VALVLAYIDLESESGLLEIVRQHVIAPAVLVFAVGGTLFVVTLGSVYKVFDLWGGGRVVAEHLGGRRLNVDTSVPAERQLINVVEEMAIASGMAAPPVFLIESEDGINAFAAGYSLDDTVIGVTRGTAERLSRDELQGVIAHELSHILNGDMRLNLRLIGLLHVIMAVALIGQFVFGWSRTRVSADEVAETTRHCRLSPWARWRWALGRSPSGFSAWFAAA